MFRDWRHICSPTNNYAASLPSWDAEQQMASHDGSEAAQLVGGQIIWLQSREDRIVKFVFVVVPHHNLTLFRGVPGTPIQGVGKTTHPIYFPNNLCIYHHIGQEYHPWYKILIFIIKSTISRNFLLTSALFQQKSAFFSFFHDLSGKHRKYRSTDLRK